VRRSIVLPSPDREQAVEQVVMWMFTRKARPAAGPDLSYGAMEGGGAFSLCWLTREADFWTFPYPDEELRAMAVMAMQREDEGYVLTHPPVRFGIDTRVTRAIRAGDWDTVFKSNLLVAFFMVSRP
jgi:hypothetical protein